MKNKNSLTVIADNVKTGTAVAFYSVFLFFFLFITATVMFGNVGYDYNSIGLFAAVSVASFLLIFTLRRADKYSLNIFKYDKIWLLTALIAVFTVQMILGCSLRFESDYDFAAVYKGAVQWAETGTFADYYDYYDWFPNNLGAMTLLYIAFKGANTFGISDYFAVGVVLNSVLITLTMLFSYLSAKKLAPANAAVSIAVLMFFLLSPPFYIMGAAFYTDSLSMLFPILFYYVYLCLKESNYNKKAMSAAKRKLLFVLMGIIITVGTMIKFTVIIMAVAVLADALFDRKIIRAVCIFISVSVCFVIAQFCLNSYLYTNHLDAKLAAQKNTPIGHWIMMGLNSESNGAYHPDDYSFTRSFADTEERDKAISREIKERIKDNGISGLSRLFATKLKKAFGDGTFAISDFLDDGPIKEGKIHSYVLYQGEQYYKYKYMTQIPLLTAYVFAIAGAVNVLKHAVTKCNGFVLAPFVAVLGLIIFLALWESSSRYFLNFVPVIYICGSCAFLKEK